ncbi:hypothetical protein GCM10011414_07630 [Croceivirga lutea]|uniref:hypothetical protein n=1 Tax=Croceivirga lutea TaxID=1775167 RepID=UPI00163A4653|nr:hypothetical protein [Croceivirga lutea]GGG40603.1 hypothetical protein GCM10011414_07630 [Croceivirga lutea]
MKKKSNWFWNVVIALTLIGCTLAFALHYKNYTSIEEGNFKLMSGIYRQQIPLTALNSIEWMPKIPEMERKNGFSWLAKEKGVFIDSITGANIYVFVDDLRQQKVKVTHSDSLLLYFNLADSLETQKIFASLEAAITKKAESLK